VVSHKEKRSTALEARHIKPHLLTIWRHDQPPPIYSQSLFHQSSLFTRTDKTFLRGGANKACQLIPARGPFASPQSWSTYQTSISKIQSLSSCSQSTGQTTVIFSVTLHLAHYRQNSGIEDLPFVQPRWLSFWRISCKVTFSSFPPSQEVTTSIEQRSQQRNPTNLNTVRDYNRSCTQYTSTHWQTKVCSLTKMWGDFFRICLCDHQCNIS
jgi:hypothetical protein